MNILIYGAGILDKIEGKMRRENQICKIATAGSEEYPRVTPRQEGKKSVRALVAIVNHL